MSDDWPSAVVGLQGTTVAAPDALPHATLGAAFAILLALVVPPSTRIRRIAEATIAEAVPDGEVIASYVPVARRHRQRSAGEEELL